MDKFIVLAADLVMGGLILAALMRTARNQANSAVRIFVYFVMFLVVVSMAGCAASAL